MTLQAPRLAAFLGANKVAIVARLTTVRGSSPREQGTFMAVGPETIFGTIGGGALEYLVIAHARRLIANGQAEAAMDVPLGPEIGQCCGGRVGVELRLADAPLRQAILAETTAADARLPHVFVFGAGNVGRALVHILAIQPVRTHWVDTRRDTLEGGLEGVERHATAMPEAVARTAPPGSAFAILTHDHALDFLIAQEALGRPDAPYVGMVGSRTKRARFASWFVEEGGDPQHLERLVLPIGQQGLGDKRPEVIAALAAAEILVQIGRREAFDMRAPGTRELGAVIGR